MIKTVKDSEHRAFKTKLIKKVRLEENQRLQLENLRLKNKIARMEVTIAEARKNLSSTG